MGFKKKKVRLPLGVAGNWRGVTCSVSAIACWQVTGLQPTGGMLTTPRPEAASKSQVQGVPTEKDGGLGCICAPAL